MVKINMSRQCFINMATKDFIKDRSYSSNTFATFVSYFCNHEIEIDKEYNTIIIHRPKGDGYKPINLSDIQYVYDMHEDLLKEIAEELRDAGNTKHIAKMRFKGVK